jgi:phosphate/sulfate permease
MSRSKNPNSSPPSKSRLIQVCLFLVRLFVLGVVTLVLLIGVAWAFGALWFDFPFSAFRRPLAAAFGLGAIAALAFVRPRWGALLGVVIVIALVAV